MATCVEIYLADDGRIEVALCDPREEAQESAEGGDLERMPAKDIDEALAMARQLLSEDHGAAEPPEGTEPEGEDETSPDDQMTDEQYWQKTAAGTMKA